MKRYLFLVFALVTFANTHAYERISFNISKPLCLLTFLQASNGTGSIAPALATYIKKNIPKADSVAFYKMVNEFSEITTGNNYVFSYYPERRQYPKTLISLITIAAVQSATTEEFLGRIVGFLPNEQWMKLKNVMAEAAPYYDKMIFHPYETEIKHQLTELRKYNTRVDDIFNKLKHFYGSTWSDDMPFTISVYPVPGSHGTTTATPHSNSLVLAVLNIERDYSMNTGVAIHEICHVLYQEQPLSLQQKIDSFFLSGNSAYKQYAYSYIDEALATACGNGWAYKMLAGHQNNSGWYADDYIDGYSHAIYPLVEEYIQSGKTLDKAFVEKAIGLFAEKFPDAIYNYPILLNRVNLYTDADNNEQYSEVTSTLYKYFKISSCAGAYPITDPQALDMIDQTTNTQLFVVYANHHKNYEALKSKFPQLKDMQEDKEGIINFLDKNNRPVVLVNARNLDRLDLCIKKLAASRKMDPGKTFIPLE